jgi:outer membrane lipoprotein-sorting protein
MRSSLRIVCGIGVLSIAFANVAAAETAEEVMTKIAEMNKKITAMKAHVKTVTSLENEMMKQNSVSDGNYEYLVKDGKTFLRMEATTTGTYSYMLNDQDGQKTAMKMKASSDMNPADPFAGLRDNYNVKLLPDETIDGESVYVLELTPKSADAMGGGRMLQYYRKDNGTIVKIVSFDANNKPSVTVTYSNVELNPSIGADRFVFTPPAGVEVMDMSNE